jgi:hypothetical protein
MRGKERGASCSAQARERSRAGPLVWALHGGGEVAAGGEVLGAAGRRGEGWRRQREATGGGGARPRRVGASARRIDGREGREIVGGRRCRWPAARSRAGRGDGHKDDFAISKSSRDLSVNKQ